MREIAIGVWVILGVIIIVRWFSPSSFDAPLPCDQACCVNPDIIKMPAEEYFILVCKSDSLHALQMTMKNHICAVDTTWIDHICDDSCLNVFKSIPPYWLDATRYDGKWSF